MNTIEPKFVLRGLKGQLIVFDTHGRVWRFDESSTPAKWEQFTELPLKPDPREDIIDL
jgi:hypothetical protein